jgi:hypothetical protein
VLDFCNSGGMQKTKIPEDARYDLCNKTAHLKKLGSGLHVQSKIVEEINTSVEQFANESE